MHISVFGQDANPAIDKRFMRKSLAYCEQQVRDGLAKPVDETDIRRGIQLVAKLTAATKVDSRGSREQFGCLTSRESALNAEYDGTRTDVGELSQQYEHALDKHIRDGRKGLPSRCAVIAARVKTILSVPTVRAVTT